MSKFGEVTVAMTTFPPRLSYSLLVMKALWPQCNHLKVCLNEFLTEPPEIKKFRQTIRSSISESHTFECVLANGENGIEDLGCNNKMRWVDDCKGYYLTVDDDIYYPPDYVETLVSAIDYYNGQCVCSFHGKLFREEDGKIRSNKPYARWPMFHEAVTKTMRVHMAGMGVAGMVPRLLGVGFDLFNTFTVLMDFKNNVLSLE